MLLAQPGGTLTPTGNMPVSCHSHTATLLSDGKVPITGGDAYHPTGDGVWASAERYDPPAGVFVATGNMTRARRGYTATVFPGGVASVSAELYDPDTETFSVTGVITIPREMHTAVLLKP